MNRTQAGTLAVCALLGALGPMSAGAAGFTKEQADSGRALYVSQCAQCHGVRLEGVDAPALSEETMQNFGTAGGLFDMIAVAMPPQNPGTLGDDAYLEIVAYILEANGAQAGSEAMVLDYDLLDAIDLVAATAAGALAASETADAGASAVPQSDVPQAFTWGKPLDGSNLFQPADAIAALGNGIPQAFTWGKPLPGSNLFQTAGATIGNGIPQAFTWGKELPAVQ